MSKCRGYQLTSDELENTIDCLYKSIPYDPYADRIDDDWDNVLEECEDWWIYLDQDKNYQQYWEK